MSIEKRIIEAVDDGELFANVPSLETTDEIMIGAGWNSEGTTSLSMLSSDGDQQFVQHWFNRDSFPRKKIRVVYSEDKLTGQLHLIKALGYKIIRVRAMDPWWIAPDLSSPEGLQKLERYATDPEAWK